MRGKTQLVLWSALLVSGFLFYGVSSTAIAGEHGGKEHGGKEHGGKKEGGLFGFFGDKEEPVKEPEPQDIKDTMKEHLDKESKNGAFKIYDKDARKMRELELVRIHRRVGKTGDSYYSCCDVKDRKTGEMLDIDVDVKNSRRGLSVSDVRIHKVSGKPRYTYDSNDNRIPL